jgi:hypothetical protein
MRLPLLLTLALLIACAWAQPVEAPPPPDRDAGTLLGKVIGEDGLPLINVTGTVHGAGVEESFTTDIDGGFTVTLKAGAVTVSLFGTTTKATVTAGKTTHVTLRVKRPGALVKVLNADGTPYSGAGAVRGEAFTADHSWSDLDARHLGEGRFWFYSDTPLLKLVVLFESIGDNPAFNIPWGQVVPIDGTTTVRLPPLHPLRLRVVDTAGQPVVNGTLKGTFSFLQETPWWTEDGKNPSQVDFDIVNMKTDAQGEIPLGRWPAMRFILSLRDGKTAGASVSGELKADGTCTPARYTLGYTPRTVAQTVFDRAGKPVPNAAVRLSYCWSGRVQVVTTTADAAGLATWTNLPPVRAITWGGGTAPGVLPADATTITTPLPPPVPGDRRLIYFTHSMKVDAPEGDYSIQTITYSDIGGLIDGADDEGAPPLRNTDFNCTQMAPVCGTPFSIGTLYPTTPPLLTTALGVYMPYIDEARQTVVCDLEALAPVHADGPDVTLRLRNADGTPVADVSRIAVVPAAPLALWSLFGKDGPSISAAKREGEGVWRVKLPAPGTYRVCADLLDADAPTITVGAGKVEATVTLPAPLFSVPSGTEVRWLTRLAPTALRGLGSARGTKDVPLYGTPGALLAAWYFHKDELHTLVPGAVPARRTQTVWKVRLSGKHANGEHCTSDYALGPLFPVATRYSEGREDVPVPASNNDTDEESLGNPDEKILWTGTYPVIRSQERGALGVVEIDREVDDVCAAVPDRSKAPGTAGLRRVRYHFPAGDYEAMRTLSQWDLVFLYDVPFAPGAEGYGRNRLSAERAWDGDVLMLAPDGATKVSIMWIGVGVIRDVPVPKTEHGLTSVTLPAWQDGAVLTGSAPHGGAVNSHEFADGYAFRVEADDSFRVKGLLPGPVILLRDFPLRLYELPAEGEYAVSALGPGEPVLWLEAHEARAYWWVPDGGTPVALPLRHNKMCVRDLPDRGVGWLWCVSDAKGGAVVRRLVPEDGLCLPASPTLGLTVPFNVARQPGAVSLVGTGASAGLTVDFPEAVWKFSPYVGVAALTLTVPPGTYTVRVDTPAGPLQAPVTVTADGGVLAFPVK